MIFASDKFSVRIRSKSKTLYDGMAYSVTSKNENGEFDVLSMHGNLIAVVYDYLIIDKGQSTEQHIAINSGLVINEKNKLSIYVAS